jgi:uncharacterized cupin superfamily protein
MRLQLEMRENEEDAIIEDHKAEGELGGWTCTDGKWRRNKTRDTTAEEDKEWC